MLGITKVNSYENIFCIFLSYWATDRRCPPASYVGLIHARRTNRDPIARAARPLGMFACLALSRPNLTNLVLRGTTLGSHFTLFRLSLNNVVAVLSHTYGRQMLFKRRVITLQGIVDSVPLGELLAIMTNKDLDSKFPPKK